MPSQLFGPISQLPDNPGTNSGGLADCLLPNAGVTRFPEVNTFSLAGYSMPGKWTLESAEKQFGWQINKGYGLDGAFVLPVGDELMVPKFKGEIWNDTDVDTFRLLRKQFLIKPSYVKSGSGAVAAMAIGHPELHAFGCTAVVIAKITVLTQVGGGLWTCNIDFIQYRPPKVTAAQPDQVIPDTKNPLQTAIDSQAKVDQDLNAQAAARAGA